MDRHPIDKPRNQDNARLREFIRQERHEGLHPAIKALHARSSDREGPNRKLAEYARVERGRLA